MHKDTIHLEEKLTRLLRYHRQRVFDATTGDMHHRAILRLKLTTTFKNMAERNADRARQRYADALTRMGY
jgi:hypothetical protein